MFIPKSPPKISHPPSSRWYAVFPIGGNEQIWILSLNFRKAPDHYYPVLCNQVGENAIACYSLPHDDQTILGDARTFCGWGQRFFWSQVTRQFVVQILVTFDPSERVDTRQIVIGGEDFKVLEIRENANVRFLPDSSFIEVFPQMHPDRSRN